MASYAPPSGDAIDFDFTGVYLPPAGDAIVFDLGSTAEPVEPPPLPSGLISGLRLPWDKSTDASARKGLGWQTSSYLPRAVSLLFANTPKSERHIVASWNRMVSTGVMDRLPWGDLNILHHNIDSGWIGILQAVDDSVRTPWDVRLTFMDIGITAPYHYPPAKDRLASTLWDDSIDPVQTNVSMDWNYPPSLDEHLMSQWGDQVYARICLQDYVPPVGDQIHLNIDRPLQQAGLDFNFSRNTYDIRCSQQHPGGWRDAYPSFNLPSLPPKNQILEVYIIVNTISVVKLPERTPVEVGNIILGIDVDSWSWRLSAVVLGDASIALIRPDISGVKEIEVNINGYAWEFVVEEYTKNQEFKVSSHSITGRSKTAYLSDPYRSPISYVETNLRTAQQLAEQEVTALGWSVNWYTVGWNVDAGAYYYNGKTPIQAVSMIAGAVGATVRPHRSVKSIGINPRYPISPWNWAAATPAATITTDIIKKISGKWDPKPPFNGVYVSGESLGVSCFVKRTGTAGDLLAPEIVDTLITHQDAGRERGRNILADQGKQELLTIDVPLVPSPGIPGLFDIGELLEVDEGPAGAWRGQVMGVNIQVTRNQKSLSVNQSITIERHHT